MVAEWVLGHANKRGDAEYTVVDIAEYNLPLFDEPIPPRMSRYQGEHTKAWATMIDRYDAFVFVTPEYNHSISAALKNAIDYLFREWQHKAAGFVSYGADKGVRAVEHLRQIVGELAMADVRAKVALSLRSDFANFSDFKPRDHHMPLLDAMLDEVVLWGEALKLVRETHRFNPMGQPIEKMGPISDAGSGPSNTAPDLIRSAIEIADRWNAALAAGDIDTLTTLYDPEVILESPAVYMLDTLFPGTMHGIKEVRAFLNAVIQQVPLPLTSRRPPPLADGRLFMWEFRARTAGGDSRDFVEVMELRNNLIFQHRFYWGWRGISSLSKVGTKGSSSR
jgi:NAD(P)H-dependent FMN reductase